MNVIRVRRRILVATGGAVVVVVVATGTAWACGVRPGWDGRAWAGTGLPGAAAGATVVIPQGRAGNGWVPGPCGPRPTEALTVEAAADRTDAGGSDPGWTDAARDRMGPVTGATAAASAGLTGCEPGTGAGSPRPRATSASGSARVPRPATSARPPSSARHSPASRTAPAPATSTAPPSPSGPALWGPFTMTLSSVPPVVNPWQTGELTAPSTRLVTSVRCSAHGTATVQVSLYNAALTKTAVGSRISCDGRTYAGSFDVNRGGTYYVSFAATGAAVTVTASVSAR